MKITVLDGYAANPGDISWAEMREQGQLKVYDRTLPDEVFDRANDSDIILTNKVAFTDTIMSRLPKLRLICVLATGYNIIDTIAARQHGITVCNVPAYSTFSVAQMVFAHILNIINRVDHYASQNREGRWCRNPDFCYWDSTPRELAGMTIGIVGLGNIGKRVAMIARALGLDIFAYTSKNSADLPDGIQKTTLDGLFAVSDILTLHCPLTADTRGMINRERLLMMKRGAILINTSRGPLVNESDVAAALRSGQLSAYGADVMTKEPPAADNPLLACPNAFITPHIAWATLEARRRLIRITVENVKGFIEGRPQNVVN